jgi:hypothetical protein
LAEDEGLEDAEAVLGAHPVDEGVPWKKARGGRRPQG